jgi:hypothetical protein
LNESRYRDRDIVFAESWNFVHDRPSAGMAPPPFDRNDAAGDQPASCCEVPEHCPGLRAQRAPLARVALQSSGLFRCGGSSGRRHSCRDIRTDFAPCPPANSKGRSLRPRPIAYWKLARGVIAASAPEQREQDDDRKGKSEYPQQQAATEAHHVLLWFVDSREPPQTAPGLSPSAQTGAAG